MAEHRAVLLLGFLIIAWAGTGADARPTCEREALAARIARACEHDGAPPTTRCCIAVVASVKLGGGVPCLCRVAAQPQVVLARLNASHLLALYAACGGRLSMRSGGAHLCPPGGGGRLLAAQCDSPDLSDQLVRHCEVGAKMPSSTCCAAVLSTVDSPDRDCLCTVSEKGDFLLSYLSVSSV